MNTNNTDLNTQALTRAPMVSSKHREECTRLQIDAEGHRMLEGMLQGVVRSREKSTLGLGVIKLTVIRENHSYKIHDALYIDPEELDTSGARWITLNPNTSLHSALKEYGDRLLAYNSTRNETTFELLGVDVFEANAKSTRILVRNGGEARQTVEENGG